MNRNDIMRALAATNTPSAVLQAIGAALADLDCMYAQEDDIAMLKAELIAEQTAHEGERNALKNQVEFANETIAAGKVLYNKNRELRESVYELQQENAALRAKLDTCKTELASSRADFDSMWNERDAAMINAEGR